MKTMIDMKISDENIKRILKFLSSAFCPEDLDFEQPESCYPNNCKKCWEKCLLEGEDRNV